MSYMLVSVPRLCTTVPFVYISSLIFSRVPTPLLPEAGACSLSAPFSPFTHTPKLASCSVLPSWLGGGQTTTKNPTRKKKASQKVFCRPLPPTHFEAPRGPPAPRSVPAFGIHSPAPRSPHSALHHRRCADLQAALLVVKDPLCSLFLRCQTSKLLVLGGSDGG